MLELKNINKNYNPGTVNECNLTEYLTKRTFEREIRCEVTGNDGKPRRIKGFRELTRSLEVRL